MAWLKRGDIVICTKFEVEQRFVFGGHKVEIQNYINDEYFNREAMVIETFKECMIAHGETDPEDKDEYEIMFLDNCNTLAWVSGDELVLKTPRDNIINMMFAQKQSGNGTDLGRNRE